ncbi:MAG: hypothetical protein H7838_12985 [Magnetococcus sp. DMHC-8]
MDQQPPLTPAPLPTIFVSIAAYRDSECPATLRDLFAKARHPQRVTAGVLWQVIPGEDDDCLAVPAAHAERVRGLQVDARESRGACWARSRVQQALWNNEDYFLQIDSHSRFCQDWDERFIELLGQCPSGKPVLSTYPVSYTPPDQLGKPHITFLHGRHFDAVGVLSMLAGTIPLAATPARPMPSALVSAGCLFGQGAMVREVPYDPNLYFQGEEISMAVRLWTHGFDPYTPNAVLLYHDYSNRGRPRHWSDHQDWGDLSRRATARVRHLLGIAPSTDPEVLQDLDRYGLGSQRSLAAYQQFADLDFQRQIIGIRAREGKFPPHPPLDQERTVLQSCFATIDQNNAWQNSETRSGSGSTLAATVALRAQLPAIWHSLGITILADAGCGDLNWLQPISDTLTLYLGFDVVEEIIQRNRTLFGHRLNHFFNRADICRQTLPRTDAVLCRHCLTHLPNDLVTQALEQFRCSGARYLLATTYLNGTNRAITPGDWRPVNLTAPPFSLPEPMLLLPDGAPDSTCHLGIWSLDRSDYRP